MTRKDILEYVLFVAILVNLSTQALNAYVALSHVDAPVAVEHRHSPRTIEEHQAEAPANTRVVMTSNVAMFWASPASGKVRSCTLPERSSESAAEAAIIQAEDRLRASVEEAAAASDSASIAAR